MGYFLNPWAPAVAIYATIAMYVLTPAAPHVSVAFGIGVLLYLGAQGRVIIRVN